MPKSSGLAMVRRSASAVAIVGKHEAGLSGPVQMHLLTDPMRGVGELVRRLDHQPVVRRQAHIVFQHTAQIRGELDRDGEGVGVGDRRGGQRETLRPQREHPAVGWSVIAAANGEPALGAEDAGRLDAAAEEIGAADETRDERVGGALVKLALRADLLHLPVGHDDQPIGHRQRLLLIVRDHHRGQPKLLLQLADLDPHLLPQLGVEIRERLVEQQDVGLYHERPGERDALLLPTRKLPRQPPRQSFQAHEAKGLDHFVGRLFRRHVPHLESESHVFRNGEMRKQRVALEHKTRVALPRGTAGDVGAIEADRARRRRDEAGDHPQRGCLSAPRGPKEHDELALRDVEVDVGHRTEVAVGLGEAGELEARHRGSAQSTRVSFT